MSEEANEVKHEEAKELYFKRWGIETKFDELKNKFQIENFSGVKPLIIDQDFYATLLLSNIATIFQQEAEEELIEENAKKNLKYEYKINKNIMVGKLKNSLIEMLLENDEDKKSILYAKFIRDIKRNVVPVIKGRAFERNKSISTSKHSKTRRRAL
ncbi:MAG TPA: transposase [Clostridia bacterium]|nr:transposase [Clostridia bacterium]